MLSDKIRIGDRIEVADLNELGRKNYFKTKVDNILDSTKLAFHAPLTPWGASVFETGSTLEMYIFEDGILYLYIVKVIEEFNENNIKMLMCEVTLEPKSAQRRDFFRHDCNIQMMYNFIPETKDEEKEIQHTVIKNIGGGGLKFLGNEDLEISNNIICQFTFKKVNFELEVLIVGKEKLGDGLKYKYRYRGEWDDISQRSEDKLVQCIFEEQLEAKKRRRELLD